MSMRWVTTYGMTHKPKPKIIVTSQICAPSKNEKKKTDLCILQKARCLLQTYQSLYMNFKTDRDFWKLLKSQYV